VEISARKENEGGKECKISKQQKAAGRGRRKRGNKKYGKQGDWDIRKNVYFLSNPQKVSLFLFVSVWFLPQKNSFAFTSFSPLYFLPLLLYFFLWLLSFIFPLFLIIYFSLFFRIS
jgi:hypothetical protein